MAKVLHISHDLTLSILQAASDCIQSNGVLAVATESSYALAAGAQCQEAIKKVVEMKGNRRAKPLLLLVSSRAQVLQVVSEIPPMAEVLMDHFWPGPLTLILPAAPDLPKPLTAETGSIGVRQPDHHSLLQILAMTGPVTGTSANRSGQSPMTTPEKILSEFGEELDLIFDSGPSRGGKASTLVEVGHEVCLLRRGPISIDVMQEVLTPHGLQIQDSTC